MVESKRDYRNTLGKFHKSTTKVPIMARQARIRWDKTTKRWYVYFNGRNKYLGYGRGQTDSESYKLAQDKWDEIRLDGEAKARAAKPHADQYQRAIALREAMVDWCISN